MGRCMLRAEIPPQNTLTPSPPEGQEPPEDPSGGKVLAEMRSADKTMKHLRRQDDPISRTVWIPYSAEGHALYDFLRWRYCNRRVRPVPISASQLDKPKLGASSPRSVGFTISSDGSTGRKSPKHVFVPRQNVRQTYPCASHHPGGAWRASGTKPAPPPPRPRDRPRGAAHRVRV